MYLCCHAGSAVQALVQGLQTSVLYQIWMQAVTGGGPGLTTDVIRIITPSETPSPSGSSNPHYYHLLHTVVCQTVGRRQVNLV